MEALYDETRDAGLASPYTSVNPSMMATSPIPDGHSMNLPGSLDEIPKRILVAPTVPKTSPEEFSLAKQIARGGFGEVWQATQNSLHRTVAIKRLRNDRLTPAESSGVGDGERTVEVAFHHEALITANLSHPNIVPIHELGMDAQGRLLLAMKLIEGELWSDRLRSDLAKLGVRDFLAMHVRVLAQVAQAVAFAHSRGIVHRDLKPSQVMVGQYGEVQLMDWGLSLVFDERGARRHLPHLLDLPDVPTLANSLNPAGTPAYMAPEQLDRTCARIGPHTDVFLLGAILYLILTGYAPYADVDPQTSMARAAAGRCVPLLERAGPRLVPPELATLCTKAMRPDPQERMGSAAEFQKALTDYLADASRRWDSMQITAQVRTALERPEVKLNDLEIADALLGNAEGLWRENQDIEPLRKLVASSYAALSTVDDPQLASAILRAARLRDQQLRDYIILHIERSYAAARRSRALRTEAVVAGLAAALLLAVLAIRLMMG